MELSFGEQIKILLKRKNMTIKELADLYVEKTGMPMSRQNLTQRLRRDNFPEQDMRILAALLGYQVSIQLEPTDGKVPELFPAALGCSGTGCRQHLLRKHWKKQSRISTRIPWIMRWKHLQRCPQKLFMMTPLPPVRQKLRSPPMHTRPSRFLMHSGAPVRLVRSIL